MNTDQKIELEYIVRCSPSVLYTFLSTPSGLSEWFCDDVNVKNGIYTFIWKPDYIEQAKILSSKDNQFIRFKWINNDDSQYFEFRIVVDEITSEVALLINDYSEVDDREETILFWNNSIHRLHEIIGS
jgi:uncharacterized protein YndB with AHSA1/START domain